MFNILLATIGRLFLLEVLLVGKWVQFDAAMTISNQTVPCLIQCHDDNRQAAYCRCWRNAVAAADTDGRWKACCVRYKVQFNAATTISNRMVPYAEYCHNEAIWLIVGTFVKNCIVSGLSINNWFSSAISSPQLWLIFSSGSGNSLPIGDSFASSFQICDASYLPVL